MGNLRQYLTYSLESVLITVFVTFIVGILSQHYSMKKFLGENLLSKHFVFIWVTGWACGFIFGEDLFAKKLPLFYIIIPFILTSIFMVYFLREKKE